MSNTADRLLVQYLYDALDRLVGCVPANQPRRDRFYLSDRLATEIHGSFQYQVFQTLDVLLAESHGGNTPRTSLLLTDKHRSVLQSSDGTSTYTPYGHRTAQGGLSSLLAFNGERNDTITGCYLLGNGHRAFNPVLMRFNSPDSLSPFGDGGLNCYAYCQGDPINRTDPTGRIPHGLLWFANGLMEFGGSYVLPFLAPKALVRRLPFVAGAKFGRAAKVVAATSAFAGTVSYIVLNRMEEHHPESPVNDPLLIALVALAAIGTVSGFGALLHKRAQLPRIRNPLKPYHSGHRDFIVGRSSRSPIPISPREPPASLPISSTTPRNRVFHKKNFDKQRRIFDQGEYRFTQSAFRIRSSSY
ncbi:RHS repeat-associated core domain-containing protein [Pseudomonas sp. OA65]|uniref:RHS repeat-associated core domain-containing protein n=1 Tax=Pseudomonas sp. OA65 TaxID=2818431 RepID=UPI001A9E380C|nr:RHS repeat-associated core domain-containing protein [Pseudomonas sp. OA65]MBO1537501.1 RHS repeat-associated core domain-containing protein [Pseudomonas sp. OA65]